MPAVSTTGTARAFRLEGKRGPFFGPGWQTRIDEALKKIVGSGK